MKSKKLVCSSTKPPSASLQIKTAAPYNTKSVISHKNNNFVDPHHHSDNAVIGNSLFQNLQFKSKLNPAEYQNVSKLPDCFIK